MRRAIALAVTVGALACAPAASAAPQDTVAGSGLFPGATHLNINGHGTLTDARGQANFKFTEDLRRKGEVDCINAIGNRAAVAGTFDEPITTSGGITFTRFIILIEDAANGNSKKDPVRDGMLTIFDIQTQAQPDCGFSAFSRFNLPRIEQGNLTVHDKS
jgi:hypothetical protein